MVYTMRHGMYYEASQPAGHMSRSDTAAIYMNVVLRLSRSIKPIIGRERQKKTQQNRPLRSVRTASISRCLRLQHCNRSKSTTSNSTSKIAFPFQYISSVFTVCTVRFVLGSFLSVFLCCVSTVWPVYFLVFLCFLCVFLFFLGGGVLIDWQVEPHPLTHPCVWHVRWHVWLWSCWCMSSAADESRSSR